MQVIDTLEPRNPLSAFIAAVAIVLTISLSSCGELSDSQSDRVREALSDTLLSTTETWGVDMELMEEGNKKVRIKGSYAATYNNEEMNETHIDGPVKVQVYDSTGAVETRVTSNSAIYRARQTIFQLYGNVKVRTSTGRNLDTEYLKWDQASNKVSTPQFVIITAPDDSIAGSGFEGTTNLSKYTIREVSGNFTVN